MSDKKIEIKTEAELREAGFISQEQYEEAVKATFMEGPEYAPAGQCGCNFNKNVTAAKTQSTYTAVPGVLFPNAASLIAGMPPVYNQQHRGTCVSMAVTALAEYYTGCKQKFSQQYLYCKCKEYEHKLLMRQILKWFKNCDTLSLLGELQGLCDEYTEAFLTQVKDAIEDNNAQAAKLFGKKIEIAQALKNEIITTFCSDSEDVRKEIYNYLASKKGFVNYSKLLRTLLGFIRSNRHRNICTQLEIWFDRECAKAPECTSALLQLKKQILPPLRRNKKEDRRLVYDFLTLKQKRYRSFQKMLVDLLRTQEDEPLFLRMEKFFKNISETSPALSRTISPIKKYIRKKLNSNNAKNRRYIYRTLYESLIMLQGGGTAIEIAANCYNTYGICSYMTWPYCVDDIDFNEGQFVNAPETFAPPEADEEAARNIPADKMTMIFPPNNLDAYKAILSGANGNRPMPIAIGMTVFQSWQRSRFTKKTGWISPPVDGDSAEGGHAMLIVGYQDSPDVAGGGYFLVRNSWGTDWAFGSESAGYAKIPYLYVRLYANSAATIIQKTSEGEQTADTPFEKYLTLASKDMKDRRGFWTISKGDRIIVDPSGTAERDTPENRKLFADNGFSWGAAISTPAPTRSIVVPPQTIVNKLGASAPIAEAITEPVAEEQKPAANTPEALDFACGVMREFIKNLDSNLKQKMSSYCFPNINLPSWTRFWPRQLRVKKIDMVADLSDKLLDTQEQQGVLNPQDRAMAARCNLCRVYELRNGSIVFRVVAIFMTAIRNGNIQQVVDNFYIDCAKDVIKSYEFSTKHSKKQPLAKICVWGTAEKYSPQVKPQFSHDQLEIITQRGGDDKWTTIHFPYVRAGYVWYDFLTHLLPLTARDRADFIEHTIYEVSGSRSSERQTVPFDMVVEKAGWPAPLVAQTLQLLSREGKCTYEKGVIKKSAGKRPGFNARKWRGASQEYLNCFISALFLAFGTKFFVNPDMSNRYDLGTIAGLALATYLGNIICAAMSRKITETEEE